MPRDFPLTTDRLTFEKRIVLTASLTERFSEAMRGISLDNPSAHHLPFGCSSASLGEFDIVTNTKIYDQYNYLYCADAIIKRPEQLYYCVPDQFEGLSDVIQAAADNEISHSPYAKNKGCVLSVRIAVLREGMEQYGRDWHIHRYPIFDQHNEKYFWNQISPNMLTSEYYISNICPTEVQTAPSEQAMQINDFRYEDTFTIDGTPKMKTRQAKAGELVVGCCFHRSAMPTQEDEGKKRIFVVISHLHTHETAAQFELDHS